jgi:hypothetical protein
MMATPETWLFRKKRPSSPYKAYGQVCRACNLIRKQNYDKTRDTLVKSSIMSAPSLVEQTDATAASRALKVTNKLDVASALRTGSRAVNELAPGVMARIIEYVEDPDHEHHLWALELLAQRILPRKLYEELGGQAAGVGSLESKRPTFQINIIPASPQATARVIEGEVIEALSAPEEE